MKIAFVRESEVKDLNPDVEEQKPLGATESCFIQLAQHLAETNTVKVFCPCLKQKFYENVEYIPLTEQIYLALCLSTFSPDIIIIVGNPRLIFNFKFLQHYKLVFWQQNHPLELLQYPMLELVKTVPIVLPSIEAQEYTKKAYQKNNIYGIYNGVRATFLNMSCQKIENKIVFVGSLIRSKGVIKFLEAAKQLPQYDFYVCGSFDMYGYIDEAYKTECLSLTPSNVKFLENLDKGQLAQEIGQAQLCVVNPLNNNYETCCVSALEAMAISTPVISGHSEILDPIISHGGVSTYLLEKTIKSLMDDPVRRIQLASCGKDWVGELTYQNITKQWNELLRSL